MGIRLSRRLAFMKGMNEKQLLDFGKSLIPLGDPPDALIIPDKPCLGTTLLSMQKAELINQSSASKEILPTLSTNSFPPTSPGHSP